MIVQCGACRVNTMGEHELGCPNAPRPSMAMSSNIERCHCPHCKGHVVGWSTVTYTITQDYPDPDMEAHIRGEHHQEANGTP